jgi:WD40-like Beta Propeller Repeat
MSPRARAAALHRLMQVPRLAGIWGYVPVRRSLALPALLALCAVLPALLVSCAPAAADVFGPISLASASAVPGDPQDQQADYANGAVISGDGRYVAFDGSFGGRTGVFRRDLLTGEVAVVAEGDAVEPSISEDGRYVSFTTTARLDEENDTNSAPDVYVRDMDRPSSQPCPEQWEASEEAREACAFTLVSAVNGSAQGLSYAYGANQSFEETHLGSLAAGRSALSADGRYVAFVTSAISNLANPNRPSEPAGPEPPETPALQVAVRDLQTRETKLVSVVRDPVNGGPALSEAGQPEPVPTVSQGTSLYGAVYSGSSPPVFPSSWAGASISADGSTVAWMGQQIGEQAQVLSASDVATQPQYTEPLWRRIGEGPQVPTRRVTGGSDPANPLCAASGETQLAKPPTLSDPCQGPFDTLGGIGGEAGLWTGGTEYDYLPRLSADGSTVAFIADAREVAGGEEFKTGESSSDLYVADMRDGLTRVEALRRLTELAGGNFSDPARVAPIVDFGVSPDGTQVAFSTERTVFPLGSPALVSAPAAQVGLVELYDADLADETLTRVTQGYEGQPAEAPPGTTSLTDSPSFSDDGDLLAFSSNADNLVYGDGNKAGDAFVVPRLRFAPTPTPQNISSPPAGPLLGSLWELGVTALSQRDGSVLLDVETPGGGTLLVSAQGVVQVAGAHSLAARRRGRRSRAVKARTAASVASRRVAGAVKGVSEEGLVTVALTLAPSYRGLASRPGGLSARVTLTFAAAGHKTLSQRVPVTFVRAPQPARRSRRAAAAHRRARGERRR